MTPAYRDPDAPTITACGMCGQPYEGLTLQAHYLLNCKRGIPISMQQQIDDLKRQLTQINTKLDELLAKENPTP